MLKLSHVVTYMKKLALDRKQLQELILKKGLDDISSANYLQNPAYIPDKHSLMHDPSSFISEAKTNPKFVDSFKQRVIDMYTANIAGNKTFIKKISPQLVAQGKDPATVARAIGERAALPFISSRLPKINDYNPEYTAKLDQTAATELMSVNRMLKLLKAQTGKDMDLPENSEFKKDIQDIVHGAAKDIPIVHVGAGFREPGSFGKIMGQNVVLHGNLPLVATYRPDIDSILQKSKDLDSTMEMFTNVNKLHEYSESQNVPLSEDALRGKDLASYIINNPGALYSNSSTTGGHRGQQPIEDLALLANLSGPGSNEVVQAMANLRREDAIGMSRLLKLTKKNNLNKQLLLNLASLDPSMLDDRTGSNDAVNLQQVVNKALAPDIESNVQFNKKLLGLASKNGLISEGQTLSDIKPGTSLADSILSKIRPDTARGILESTGRTRMNRSGRDLLYKHLDLSALDKTMLGGDITKLPAELVPYSIKNKDPDYAGTNIPHGGYMSSALGLSVPAIGLAIPGKVSVPELAISAAGGSGGLITGSALQEVGSTLADSIKQTLQPAKLEPLKRSLPSKL
jgi:hypothetical protein